MTILFFRLGSGPPANVGYNICGGTSFVFEGTEAQVRQLVRTTHARNESVDASKQ